jgi:hypothetical protein
MLEGDPDGDRLPVSGSAFRRRAKGEVDELLEGRS